MAAVTLRVAGIRQQQSPMIESSAIACPRRPAGRKPSGYACVASRDRSFLAHDPGRENLSQDPDRSTGPKSTWSTNDVTVHRSPVELNLRRLAAKVVKCGIS